MTDNIRTAAKTCDSVADRLQSRGKTSTANELRRIAQQLLDGMSSAPSAYGQAPENGLTQSDSFNPADDVKVGVQDFRSENEQSGGMHPGISTFVKPSTDQPSEEMDTRKIHQLSCTLKAPDGVSEADMMNYILGIGDALQVDVDSFKWSKTEPKMSKGVK